jgi:phosphate:Na+ symporter
VRFRLLSAPPGADAPTLAPSEAVTDGAGIARTRVVLGQRAGTYAIGAELSDAPPNRPPLRIELTVRDLAWWALLVLGLLGGLALFLYGMALMSEGLKNLFGRRMRTLLGSLAKNRLLAMGVGAFVTMVIQSSSATTVMLVGFVQARLMSFASSLAIILGAHIGTTITAQIIAFRITDYALLFVAGGFALTLSGGREQVRHAGRGLLGFGLLFFGMRIMSDAMRPLAAYEPFLRLVVALEWPALGIVLGAAFTALIQSSSAFTGILIVLGSQGLLSLNAAIPLVLGANVGTCVTALLAGLTVRREAKRVALAHTLFQLVGVVLLLPWLTPFADAVRWVSPLDGGDAVARQIANAHTLFNVTMTLVFLPFTGPAARFVAWLLPDLPPGREARFSTAFLDESMLATPSFALSLANAEVLRMAELVQGMVEQCAGPFVDHRHEALPRLQSLEEEVDFLRERIDEYLTRIGQRNITEAQTDEAFQLMYAVTELEQIADIVGNTIRPLAQEWLGFPRRFSRQGEAELRDMHLRTVKQMARAITLLRKSTPQWAEHMRAKYRKYRALEMDLMRTHFERLRQAIPESVATAEFHQELLEQLVRIAGHATNIARLLIESDRPPRAAPEESRPPAAAEASPATPAAPDAPARAPERGEGEP